MKKFFSIIVLLVLCVVSVSARRAYIRSVEVLSSYPYSVARVNLSDGVSLQDTRWSPYFVCCHSGDEVDYEVSGRSIIRFVNIDKEFARTEDGQLYRIRRFDWGRKLFRDCGGVVYGNAAYGVGGVYGSAYGVGGAAVVETRNFGVSYDPYTGVNVRIGDGRNGFGAVNIPVRFRSRKARTTTNDVVVNNSNVTTNRTAVQTVRTSNVRTVSVDELVNANSNANRVVKAVPTRSNTTTTTVTRSASKLYDGDGRLML